MSPRASMPGIVTAARRPPGWRAPGPPPAAPIDRLDAWPRQSEALCHLAGDWRILQRSDGHRWSLDDLVTAWLATVAAPAAPARVADLGCGIGAVLMLVAWRYPAARCVGIEAEALSVALARRSLVWNGAADRCEIRLGDLRDPQAFPAGAVFDLVTGTPPYLAPGTATVPRRLQNASCHLEQRGGIDAYCAAAARLLAPAGRFVVCAAAAQWPRVARAAANAGLAITLRRDVVPRAGKAPLFAVYVMQHAAAAPGGVDAVAPPLVVRDREGSWTPEFRDLRRAMGMPS